MPLPVTSDLLADYDPSALGLSNGATINPFTDATGHGHDLPALTAGPTYQTSGVNGLPAAHFNGTTQSCGFGDNVHEIITNAGFTVYLAFQLDDASKDDVSPFRLALDNATGVLTSLDEFRFYLGKTSNLNLSGYSALFGLGGASAIAPADVSLAPLGPHTDAMTIPTYLEVSWDGSSATSAAAYTFNLNGTDYPLQSVSAFGQATNRLGLSGSGSGDGQFNGSIARFLVYGRPLTTDERTAMRAYFQAALTATSIYRPIRPPGHPLVSGGLVLL